MEVNGEEVSVKVEYAPDEYRTLDQLENIVLTNPMGASVALTDVAEIGFKDSPLSITRTNKQYQVRLPEIIRKRIHRPGEGKIHS